MRTLSPLCGLALAVLGLPIAPPWALAAEPGKGTEQALVSRLEAVMINAETRTAMIDKGRELASVCDICHGLDGNSKHPDVPRLAGQNPVYLWDQLKRFADGRRGDYIMPPIARHFDSEQMLALAVYFSSLPLQAGPNPAPGQAVVDKGKLIYQSKCRACHGDNGRGTGTYPRLAGQWTKYLAHRLVVFQKQRTGIMSEVARGLTNADIDAVAAYAAHIR